MSVPYYGRPPTIDSLSPVGRPEVDCLKRPGARPGPSALESAFPRRSRGNDRPGRSWGSPCARGLTESPVDQRRIVSGTADLRGIESLSGARRNPSLNDLQYDSMPRFTAGDVVEIEIEDIGVLRNPVR